jgi:HEPN domain-containing protein
MSESNDESSSALEEDYEFAENLLRKGEYHHSCFYAQQVGVKAVKTALNEFGLSNNKGSVTTLVDDLKAIAKVPADILQAAEILDGCYIPPAFPGASDTNVPRGQYTRERAEEALKQARKMMDFTKNVISNRPEKQKRLTRPPKRSRRT